MNLVEVLARSARDWPQRPAILEGDDLLPYDALWREVEAMRVQLARLGVVEGQGVGVMARNGSAFVVAALGTLACGGVVMPLHPHLKPAELAETLSAAPLATVIRDCADPQPLDGSHHSVSLLGCRRLSVTRRLGCAPGPLVPWEPEAAFVRFTSGTTGAAKGVILTHRGVIERVQAANEGLGLGPRDTVVWVLPMAYHFFVSIVLYLSVGASIVVCPDHLAGSILEASARHRATFLYAAPLHIRMLAAEASGRRFSPSLQRVMSVSSPLVSSTARDFSGRFGLPVSQGYGIIEVGLPILNLADAAEHPEAIGRALPAFEVAILDEEMNPVTAGETGQLALRGPGMFAGYLTPPLRREAVLREGFFLTGDLAHRNAEGLITLDGRCKSLINIAGHKVFPEEVSGVLDQHPAVLRSRVSMRPHPQLGEVVHAEIQLHAGRFVTTQDVLAFCRQQLSGHKVPATVAVVPEITVTPSGKVRYG